MEVPRPDALSSPLASTCFDFEADFTADLRCIPMAVRRKLDLAGIKLKLQHWSELHEAERAELLAWADDPAAIEALRQHLLERSAALSAGQAKDLPRPDAEPWQQADPASGRPGCLLRPAGPGAAQRRLGGTRRNCSASPW